MTQISRLPGYAVLVIFVAMTTAAYLENLDHNERKSPFDEYPSLEAAPRGARHERSVDGNRQGPSFSVTQDLQALAQLLHDASVRRRIQAAIDYFNSLQENKRYVQSQSTYRVHPVLENPIKNEE